MGPHRSTCLLGVSSVTLRKGPFLKAGAHFLNGQGRPPPFSDCKPGHGGGGQRHAWRSWIPKSSPGAPCLRRQALARPPRLPWSPRPPPLPLRPQGSSGRAPYLSSLFPADPGVRPRNGASSAAGRGAGEAQGARSREQEAPAGLGCRRRLPRAAVGGLFRGEEPGLGRLAPRRRLPPARPPLPPAALRPPGSPPFPLPDRVVPAAPTPGAALPAARSPPPATPTPHSPARPGLPQVTTPRPLRRGAPSPLRLPAAQPPGPRVPTKGNGLS